MNNSLGKTEGVVSAENPSKDSVRRGGESLRAVELGTCKPFHFLRAPHLYVER
jgi:hypothetical protein